MFCSVRSHICIFIAFYKLMEAPVKLKLPVVGVLVVSYAAAQKLPLELHLLGLFEN